MVPNRTPGQAGSNSRRGRIAPRNGSRLAPLLLALMVVGCGAFAPPGAAEMPAARTAACRPPRLIFIGIDGADWVLLDGCMERGECPNVARLLAHGTRGVIESPSPRISPLLWTSILTGRYPEDHGVLDFFQPGADDLVPVSSSARRVKALWDVAGDAGLRVGVVAFWATSPPEPIPGVMVSDAFAPSLFAAPAAPETVSPPSWQGRLAPLRPAADEVARLMPSFIAGPPRRGPGRPSSQGATSILEDPELHLETILASTLAYQRAALALLDDADLDVLFVYHQMIDEVCHRFMRFAPPPMHDVPVEEDRRFAGTVAAAYAFEDRLVGQLLDRAGPDTLVVLVSDHGFLSGPQRLAGDPSDFGGEAAAWHRDEGILVLAGGARATAPLTGDVYDVAPTTLALLGLPLAHDMPGRPLLGVPMAMVQSHGDRATRQRDPTSGSADALIDELAALGYIASDDRRESLSANGLVNLGLSLAARGRHDEARRAYRRALQRFPDHPMALYDLAASQQSDGRHAQALPLLTRLARLDVRLPTGSLLRLADAARRTDQPAAAWAALDSRPVGRRGWEWLAASAALHEDAGDLAGARDALARAVKAGPDLPSPIVDLLRLSAPGLERTEARRLAREAIPRVAGSAARSALEAGLRAIGEGALIDTGAGPASTFDSPPGGR